MDGGADRPVVLIVDDDPLVLRAIARELTGSFDILTATAPDHAVDHLAAGVRLAAVVCDLNPGIEGAGIYVLEMARARYPEARRILVSGAANPATVEDARRSALAHAFVAKPWTFGTILDAVRIRSAV